MLLSGAVVSAQEGSTTAAPANPSQGADNPCDRQAFSTLFTCIAHDLRDVVRGDSLVWLGTAGVLAGGSILLDDEVLNTMKDENPDLSLAAGESLGHAGLHFGAPIALYVAARATHHAGTADFAVTLLRTHVVNGILTRGVKLVPRPRPYQEVATPTKGSFPSGHTSAMFATATVIHRRWGWRGGLPAYLVASYVGTTRLQNVHYLSDVTFGAALGVAAGLAVNLPNRVAAISPIVAPGRTGVTIDIDLSSTKVH
jgi:membrane-associated phospholipid phosphatase